MQIKMKRESWLCLFLLYSTRIDASFRKAVLSAFRGHKFQQTSLKDSLIQASPLLELRGGSTRAAKDDVHAYRLQQQLYLQSRSLQLRQALIQRGLSALQHQVSDETTAQISDWDCAVATREHPKSCLYSFDAEPGSKVVAPIDTNQWITLSALNRLRRTDPTKVEPLWHSQYAILKTWFHPDSPFSLYTHLNPIGTLLAFLLDAPILLAAAMLLTAATGFLVTLPVWEKFLQMFLTHPLLWLQWPQWGRFVHAALPVKLLLGQMAWKVLAMFFGNLYGRVRDALIEWECQIWEDCIPLTILEDTEESMDGDEEDEEGEGW